LHALDAEQHVRIHAPIHPGSQDLLALFSRRDTGRIPLANDTSSGVGHAPLSALEEFMSALKRPSTGGIGTDKIQPGART